MSERKFQQQLNNINDVEFELQHDGSERGNGRLDEEPKLPEGRSEVADLVLEVDPYGKALTGRTPERLEEETGIPKEELFPEGKDIIYVGDPWQRMRVELDNKHMFIIDYEFGESAEFMSDKEAFLNSMLSTGSKDGNIGGDELYHQPGLSESIVSDAKRWLELDNLTVKQRMWLEGFNEIVKRANEATQQLDTDKLDEYEKAADAWRKAREYIETTYQQEIAETEEQLPTSPGDPEHEYDPLASFRKQAWYDCVYAERGFRDIPDWLTQIEPALDKRRIELEKAGKPEKEIEEELVKTRKTLIDRIRLRKKPENAHIIQAVFPELPFKNESFDRFVASWSI